MIPSMDTIDQYYNSIDLTDPISTRNSFPEIPVSYFFFRLGTYVTCLTFYKNGLFEYRFIPLPYHLETRSNHSG